MAPATLSHRVLSLIYPLKEPARRRQHDKSLSVLALGLSRSGTESLRHALEHLSYRDCYHGFKCGRSPPDAKVWCRLLAYKAQLARKRALSTDTGDTSWWHFDSGLTREVFDRILADCQAVTDVPCSMFVDELIRCYPDAKVVINFREDVEAWHASIKANVLPTAQSWLILVMSLFNSDFFWWFYFFRLTFNDIWGLGNWDARGQLFYEEHYTHLRRVTKQHGREALEWRATDGWYGYRIC